MPITAVSTRLCLATTRRARPGLALLITGIAAVLAACAGPSGTAGPATAPALPMPYPATAKVTQVDDYFGTSVADPYRWLEDDRSPATAAWVQAQNTLTNAYLDRLAYRKPLLARLRQLVDYPRDSAPFVRRGKLYFYRNDGLQNQPVLQVQDGPDGAPEPLIDPNTFSPDGTVRLTRFSPSRDGRHAVVGRTAIPGSDWQEWQVMDLQTRQMLPERLRWIKFSTPAWRGDGFYYVRLPEPAAGTELTARTENQKVYFHKLGTPQADDALVFEDTAHPTWFVDIETTQDERHAAISQSEPGKRGNSLLVRDETRGERAFRPVVAEPTDNRYVLVDSVGAQLLVLTDLDAPKRRVVRIDPARPAPTAWRTVIAEREETLEEVSSAGGRLFASYLKDVVSEVRVYQPDGQAVDTVQLPGPGAASGFDADAEAKDVYYVFGSMNQPPSIYRYTIADQRSALVRAPKIPGFDPARYESRQLFYASRDGTRVPMFLVHKKGLVMNGRNPTILYGYGGFNVTLEPTFSATRLAWLEQGGVFAVANLRGGGEYGEAWHRAGMREKKQNVFDDFIAAAEYLVAQGYTSPSLLAAQGGSNGGLLVGAVINQRPDLFRVAIPEVGVMDMLRFQKFSVGAAWTSDYGSSDDPDLFKVLYAYSPLHNIPAAVGPYPAVLVTTSDHDDRVVPAHSFKYAATLQQKAGPADMPRLIRIETQSGHGSSNLSKALESTADIDAFIWANMGVVPRFATTP